MAFVIHAPEHPSALASSPLALTCPVSSMAWKSAARARFLTYLAFLTFGARGTEVTKRPALAGGPWRPWSGWLHPQGRSSHQDYAWGNGKATR